MNNTPSFTIKHDIAWLDYVRVLACALVVLAHCCDAYVSSPHDEHFMAGSIWGTFYRPSVPLFIMITGALLLPTSQGLTEFYGKRLKRILLPFIFWSILSPLLFFAFVQNIPTLNPCISADTHSLSALCNDLWLWVFNFNYSTIPYWYLFMMLGIYLIIPVFSPWVQQATKKELQIIIGIWLFTTCIPYLQMALPFLGYVGNYGSFGIYGECSWNSFTTFHYLSGFIGYALIAHYLRRFPITWGMGKTLLLCLGSWAVGYAISFGGFHAIKQNFPDDFNMLEIPWAFTSINVVMMVVPIFILIQRINPRPCAVITRLSDLSFGIFLTHFIVVHLCYEFVARFIVIPPIVQLPVQFLLAFALTAGLVALLRCIPGFNKLS